MEQFNWEPVCRKIEEMIKEELRNGDHVKSGSLYNSINAIYIGNGQFNIEANDYFKYLDDEFKITDKVFNSIEFNTFMENFLAKNIENSI